MKTNRTSIQALDIILHGIRVAILVHYDSGKNRLVVNPEYRAIPAGQRPIITLAQLFLPNYFSHEKINQLRIPPLLSNLLPEGALRIWLSQSLKTHIDDEFSLLAYTGNNLPGALIAKPLPAGELPDWVLSTKEQVESIQLDVKIPAMGFSLAGVQMKFSGIRQDGRFLISTSLDADDWIIKTPSHMHPSLPANEYTAMKLAQTAGIEIPEIMLFPVNKLENLPAIALPNEDTAYAIKRFDRGNKNYHRIHAEDFAQIFELFYFEKYNKINYEQIGALVYRFSSNGLSDLQQLARRLLVNILLANGDAHAKNWMMFYPDTQTPRLAPAYDIVSTLPYMAGETGAALNLNKNKIWTRTSLEHFEAWTKKTGASWPAIKAHLFEVMSLAKSQWPSMLSTLPMEERQKKILKHHWSQLHEDFRIITN